jgi:hypothetical protein
LIIHVFFTFSTQAIPTAVFRFTVGFLPFGGLPISPLGLTVIFAPPGYTALIATIHMSPKASTTNIENNVTPPTLNLD